MEGLEGLWSEGAGRHDLDQEAGQVEEGHVVVLAPGNVLSPGNRTVLAWRGGVKAELGELEPPLLAQALLLAEVAARDARDNCVAKEEQERATAEAEEGGSREVPCGPGGIVEDEERRCELRSEGKAREQREKAPGALEEPEELIAVAGSQVSRCHVEGAGGEDGMSGGVEHGCAFGGRS